MNWRNKLKKAEVPTFEETGAFDSKVQERGIKSKEDYLAEHYEEEENKMLKQAHELWVTLNQHISHNNLDETQMSKLIELLGYLSKDMR